LTTARFSNPPVAWPDGTASFIQPTGSRLLSGAARFRQCSSLCPGGGLCRPSMPNPCRHSDGLGSRVKVIALLLVAQAMTSLPPRITQPSRTLEGVAWAASVSSGPFPATQATLGERTNGSVRHRRALQRSAGPSRPSSRTALTVCVDTSQPWRGSLELTRPDTRVRLTQTGSRMSLIRKTTTFAFRHRPHQAKMRYSPSYHNLSVKCAAVTFEVRRLIARNHSFDQINSRSKLFAFHSPPSDPESRRWRTEGRLPSWAYIKTRANSFSRSIVKEFPRLNKPPHHRCPNPTRGIPPPQAAKL